MEEPQFPVVVTAGSFRPDSGTGVVMPHRWTDGGVCVQADFTGGHLYHLAAAGCLLNDVYREAEQLKIAIDGVRVRASGAFDTATWSSTGVHYDIEVASPTGAEDIEDLLQVVDDVAEIPKALRLGTSVTRRPAPTSPAHSETP